MPTLSSALLVSLSCLAPQATSDHVLDRLPLAPPAGGAFVGLVAGPDGSAALVTGAAPRFVDLAVDGAALFGTTGPSGGVDLGSASGAALDPDGDGVASWWTLDASGLCEVVRGLSGEPLPGARVALPAGAVSIARDGLITAGELVGTLVAEPGAAPTFAPLWSGPHRAIVAIDGAAAACAIAPDGSVWLATPEATAPVVLAAPARAAAVRLLNSGALELVYRAESGELRRAELDRTVDGALTGIDLALAVEADAIDLANAWLVDADADGDADLVANEGGNVVVRRGWGSSGFLEPRAVLTGAAIDVQVVDGVAVVVTATALARLDGQAVAVQDMPFDDRALRALDIDGDGDIDLCSSTHVGINDGSGVYSWHELDASRQRPVTVANEVNQLAIVLDSGSVELVHTHSGHATIVESLECELSDRARIASSSGGSSSYAIETHPGVYRLLRESTTEWTDSWSPGEWSPEEWSLSEPRSAPVGAVLLDVDQDGDDDLVAVVDGALCTWFGPRHEGPDAGAFLQFGAGETGDEGVVPLLGANGPVRLSDESGRVRLVRAAADSDLFVAVTPDAGLLDQRLFPASFVVDRTQLVWLQGRTDQRGRWDFPLAFDPTLVGQTLFGQAFVLDDGAIGGISASNRLAVTYGR